MTRYLVLFRPEKYDLIFNRIRYLIRRRYSLWKKFVKLARFKSFPLQLSGNQDIPTLLFVMRHQLQYVGWAFISARSVENCISVESLNTLNTDLQSILQNINKFAAGETRSILTNTRSSRSHELCREFNETCNFIKKALPYKCFPVNLKRFLRTNIVTLIRSGI